MPPPLKPLLSLEGLNRRLTALETALEQLTNERELELRRMREERHRENEDVVTSVQTIVQKALIPVGAVHSLGSESLELLKEARDDRMIKKAKERIAEEEKLRQEAQEAEDAKELAREEANRAHRLKVWGVIVAILTIVGSLATAAIASHR